MPEDSKETSTNNPLPPGVPEEAASFLEEMGYFDADRIHVGQQAPVLELLSLKDKTPVRIGAPDAPRPCVLIFGSYT